MGETINESSFSLIVAKWINKRQDIKVGFNNENKKTVVINGHEGKVDFSTGVLRIGGGADYFKEMREVTHQDGSITIGEYHFTKAYNANESINQDTNASVVGESINQDTNASVVGGLSQAPNTSTSIAYIQTFLTDIQLSAIKSKQRVNKEYIDMFKSYFVEDDDGSTTDTRTHKPDVMSFTLGDGHHVVVPTASMVHHSQFNIDEMTIDSGTNYSNVSKSPNHEQDKISIKLTSTKPPDAIQRLIDHMSII